MSAKPARGPRGKRGSERNTYCSGCGAEKWPGKTDLCLLCLREQRKERARTLVVDAIQRWVARYGELPKAAEWICAPSVLSRISDPERTKARHRDFNPPSYSSAQRAFGSWRAAVSAAGFVPTEQGHYDRVTRGKHLGRARQMVTAGAHDVPGAHRGKADIPEVINLRGKGVSAA